MPLGYGIRYAFKRVSPEEAIRLAFKDNKVVETKVFKENKEGVLKPTKKIHHYIY